jgi:hypothetical protein
VVHHPRPCHIGQHTCGRHRQPVGLQLRPDGVGPARVRLGSTEQIQQQLIDVYPLRAVPWRRLTVATGRAGSAYSLHPSVGLAAAAPLLDRRANTGGDKTRLGRAHILPTIAHQNG